MRQHADVVDLGATVTLSEEGEEATLNLVVGTLYPTTYVFRLTHATLRALALTSGLAVDVLDYERTINREAVGQ